MRAAAADYSSNPAASFAQPKSTRSKGNRNNLEEQIAKNLMPNFVLPPPPKPETEGLPVDQAVQAGEVPAAEVSTVTPRVIKPREESPTLNEELPQTMARHMKNMAQYSTGRHNSNRRNELP